MSEELELKYTVVDGAALEAWLERELARAGVEDHDVEGASGWRDLTVTDRYFDTPAGALAAAGYGARLRQAGTEVVVGLKSDVAAEGAVHRRQELEAPATRSLRPQRWPASEVRDLVEQLAGDEPLVERFALRQRRHERHHRPSVNERWLISLDAVSVTRGGREVGTLSQLEVELREGGEKRLLALGRRLAESGLAVPQERSKLALAMAMVEAADRLRADDSLAEAGRKVLRRHFDRMLERQVAAQAGDPLALKQMRVATRRMRATWRVFAGAYRRRDERRYVDELRTVAAALGRVRDLDVLLEALPEDAGLDPLADTWRARRADAWSALLAMFESRAYRRFVRDYRKFVDARPATGAGPAAGTRVVDAAGSRMWAAYERVTAHAVALASPSPAAEELHALRIDGKRLRYTLETFRELLPSAASAALIERMVQLQDGLGALNDADVALREVDAWLGDAGQAAPPAVVDAVRGYRQARESEAERVRTGLPAAWRAVAGTGFRRQLGRAVGGLADAAADGQR